MASDSRRRILAALRTAAPPAVEAPARPRFDVRDDLVAAFVRHLEQAGGGAVEWGERPLAELSAAITERSGDRDPVVIHGECGVAESGAVWHRPTGLEQRRAALLTEHLVVVLERSAIVADLHAAYERIDVADGPFGWFLAGPSKTADIEQSLVMGAHGPRRLTVALVDGGG